MANCNETASVEEPSWVELLGSNNWEGLLEPLDLSLRNFILRCGDFCQCTYDSFNDDKTSKYAGSCRYSKQSLFDKVKFPFAADYQISCFLYGTAIMDLFGASGRETNFIGYIATTTNAASQALGRREIHVVWRGTETNSEWVDVAHFDPVSAAELLRSGDKNPAPPQVMDGWLKLYASENPESSFLKLSAREQLHTKIQQLTEEYKDENPSIVVTGHSLGGALAVLSAFDIAENVVNDSIPVAAIVFGCPQVGDENFVERVQQLPNLKILRIKNMLDPITLYPRIIVDSYRDVGMELLLDCTKSPFLRLIPNNMGDWHNLQGILHVVAGWNGADHKFELMVKRSLALVNKSCDFLKQEYSIPASWWAVQNKGMVLDQFGDWILDPPPDEDPPPAVA